MSDQNNFRGTQPERVPMALDNRKLSLTADCPTAPGKKSSLQLTLVANNPRVVVWTNDPSEQGVRDKGYGKITANLDMGAFMMAMTCLDQAAQFRPSEGNPEYKVSLENKNYIFPGGQRSAEPVVVSELHIGQDKDGLVYMSVTAKDRPRIKFVFGLSDFHHLVSRSGKEFTPADISRMYAAGWADMMREMMIGMANQHYVKPEPKNPQGGGNNRGGGGGYNNNRGSSSSGADDDIPF